jgi:hypothetical protein
MSWRFGSPLGFSQHSVRCWFTAKPLGSPANPYVPRASGAPHTRHPRRAVLDAPARWQPRGRRTGHVLARDRPDAAHDRRETEYASTAKGETMTQPEPPCVILDIPDGLRLNLLGLIVEIGRIRITADRAGLLGALLASLTCGGVESADRLEALAQMIRSQQQNGGAGQPQPTAR